MGGIGPPGRLGSRLSLLQEAVASIHLLHLVFYRQSGRVCLAASENEPDLPQVISKNSSSVSKFFFSKI